MKKLIMCLAIILLLTISSCRQLQARPEMETILRRQAIRIAELDKRCQAGDMEACKGCSTLANQTFVEIINALDGKAGDPNESN